MKYLLRYEMAEPADMEKLRSYFAEHKRRWAVYESKGSLLAIGPMENPMDGALGIFTNKADAEEFAEGDPFVLNGLISKWDVTGWAEALIPEK
ncbi:MAG: hypothetical protein JWO07_473 [Candidatus Saccharibacteria bacterium]|nr:hypothetical protein [Candidatus Saccharibacteria bacterium]